MRSLFRLLASFLLLVSTSTALAEDYYSDSLSTPDGLVYASAKEANLREQGLDELIHLAETTQTSAVLLVKDNKIVLEKYWGVDASTPIHLFSVTKSITSLGIGLLVDSESLDVHDPLKKFFPSWSLEKGPITIEQLLTHTSGLKQASDPEMEKQKDVLQYCLNLPLSNKPGSRFDYSSAGVMLLSEVIARAAHSPEDDFIQKKIFSPLKITHASWRKDAVGHVKSYLGLEMPARELLRIGQLMLARGQWEGEQIISSHYIEQALSPSPRQSNYGYLWWRMRNGFYAKGNYGQFLAVYPDEKIIFVRLKKSGPSVEKNLADIEFWTPIIRQMLDRLKRTPHG